jgi:prolipoprotein diacylglyceryltransferase
MGQWLSIPFVITGVLLVYFSLKKSKGKISIGE